MSVRRLPFLLTVLLAGATFWIAPRLPMVDLPQIAAQVAAGHDLLTGTSKWQSILYLNYFTPYLLGYGLALLLSFVLPVSLALKLVLSLSFYGFVAACIALRRRLGGDERLDWLFIPGFFGFAYVMGFYSFLVAAPLGVLFIFLALRYAEQVAPRTGVALVLAGLALFFAHGLVFLFANAIGGAFLLLKVRRLSRLLPALLPYAALGLCCVLYLRLGLRLEVDSWGDLPAVDWNWDLHRLRYPILPSGVVGVDWPTGLLVMLMLGAPLLLGARLNRQGGAALVPAIGVAVLYAVLPMHVFIANTTHVYPRFAMFFLAFYALMFRPAPTAGRPAATLWLPLLCWAFLVVHAERLVSFARESAAFDEVLAATRPGQRALGLILDPRSPAMGNFSTYPNFALWYQAEKGGFVEYNFAHLAPQVVRLRGRPADPTGRGWDADRFDWARSDGASYRYFFVRATAPLPERYFPAGQCAPTLLKSAGAWSVFENVNCHAAGPAG